MKSKGVDQHYDWRTEFEKDQEAENDEDVTKVTFDDVVRTDPWY